MYLRKTSLIAQDTLFTINEDAERVTYDFHSVQSMREYNAIWREKEPITQIYFRLDAASDISRRTVYNFFDMAGDLGGVLELITMVGVLLVSWLSHNEYIS